MKQREFIEAIATHVIKNKDGYGIKVTSPIIAQAILESKWGKSSLAAVYHNYFGMKCGNSWRGKSVNMATKEEYTPGALTDIRANFRAYDDMESGVIGYFEFISVKRYNNLKGVTDPYEYCRLIKQDGWATSSTYTNSLITLIDQHSLKAYDTLDSQQTITNPPDEPNTSSEYYPIPEGYDGNSIIDALKLIGEDPNIAHRKKIASANNFNNYAGTSAQNTKMLKLLKAGLLKREA